MTRLVLLVGMFLACGCSGDDGGSKAPTGPCVAPNGTFRMVYTEQSGTCGPVTDTLVTLGDGAGSGSSSSVTCSGATQSVSADKCSVSTTGLVCADTKTSIRSTSKFTWNPPATAATGTMQLILTDVPTGREVCNSVYGVTYSKL